MEEKLDVLNKRGEFTGNVATREECHREGLWHRAVYGFIIDKNSNVLLQKRSKYLLESFRFISIFAH